jgi:hypothetical protein
MQHLPTAALPGASNLLLDPAAAMVAAQVFGRKIQSAQDLVSAQQHNSLSGLQGGTTLERYHLTAAQLAFAATLASGSYTPTLTAAANIDAATPQTAQYLRVGNTVTVSGIITIDPTTANTLTALDMTIPIASAFSVIADCGGTAVTPDDVVLQAAALYANPGNGQVRLQFKPSLNTLFGLVYHYTYQVR